MSDVAAVPGHSSQGQARFYADSGHWLDGRPRRERASYPHDNGGPMTTRVLYFVYGCAAYVLFLGTFLYAIAFVGGFAVPTRLDGPATTPFWQALAIDAGLLAIFAVQHSVMARPWF